ncbi:MAG: dihydropteroate synthase [Lachnospiraceae bacterium]|nr:dihydropteroate synthase [Lachnospiraceae bacterium]
METVKIGKRTFDTAAHTYIMGILNVTPDSFSDGGKWNRLDEALRHTEEMIAEGADIIDVGGESTRPGYTQISEQEEIERIVPVIEGIRERFDIPVSLDTYKVDVAEAGLTAGADLLNDIWGLKYGWNREEGWHSRLAAVIAAHNAACCLMHNRAQEGYQDLMQEMKQDLQESIRLAEEAGIRKDGIVLDPGVGFGKSYENNLEAIRRAGELQELGYPLLLGTSRKSVIGLTLDLPASERLEGTLATTVYAVAQHCGFVRVHDVKENARIIRMAEAIRDGGKTFGND